MSAAGGRVRSSGQLTRVGNIRVIFQTDHDQLLIGSLPPVEEARSWRHDPFAALRGNLEGDPVTGPLVAGAEPDGKPRGTLKERCFFRRAAGPGWALVGDAGHHKDYVIGDGITEALIQAKSLAEAVREGTETALARWWRARDVEVLPRYFWGMEEGSLGPPAFMEQTVFRRLGRDPVLARRMSRLPEHRCSPYDVLPISVIIRCLIGALLRGRLQVIPEFLAQGKRAADYRRELEQRQRLLESASSSSS